MQLPAAGAAASCRGNPDIQLGSSDELHVEGHTFRAWAMDATDINDVRNGYDFLLQKDCFSNAAHTPYAFTIKNRNNQAFDNFESDSDSFSGLNILKALKTKQAENKAVFMTHNMIPGATPLTAKKRQEAISSVVAGSLLCLENIAV